MDERLDRTREESGWSRRRFLRNVGGAAMGVAAAGAGGGLVLPLRAASPVRASLEEPAKKTAENWVEALFTTLTPQQKKVMHFPFEHEKRSFVANNWNIVEPKEGAIETLYNADQQEIIRNIFRSLTTEDGWERFQKQMKDDSGGLGKYTCALFGEPDTGKFEFVLTGRHLTLRADGDSVENASFGGPVFYGHAVEFNEKPDHPGNVWWHQSKLANSVFAALDGKQREKALLEFSPEDSAEVIRFAGKDASIPGLRCADLSSDQKELVKSALGKLLGMFRESDVAEVMRTLDANGGVDELRMSFYKEGDLGEDQVWDRWKVEGPAFSWYFRGSPHVHVWLHAGGAARETESKRARV